MAQQFVISKIFRIATAFCVLFIIAKSASAQQLSTYEQKRYNLAKETINKMGDRLGAEKEEFLLLVGLHIAGETMANGDFKSKLEEMYYWEEIIESASNGSSSFWGNDIAKNLTYGYSLRDIYRLWKEQRKAIDKTRTQADIDREYKIKPTAGTIDQMISIVRIEFGKWAKRGKYEKTVDYQKRLNTYGIDVFDRICDSIIKKTNIWSTSPAWKVIEELYDPDKEQYHVILVYGDESYKGKLSLVCDISPDMAPYYKVGNVTEMRVDGKWLVPVLTEYSRIVNKVDVYAKTIFTADVSTEPLRICFKDIKFSYGEICEDMKNHCYTSGVNYGTQQMDVQKAEYEKLYTQAQKLKNQITELESKYYSTVGREFNFEKWFNGIAKEYDEKYNYRYIKEDEGLKWFKAHKTDQSDYEVELNSISKILDCAESEYYNIQTSRYLTDFFKVKNAYPIIEKVSVSEMRITFNLSRKEQVQGIFYKNKLKNSNGEIYTGSWKDDVLCTEDESMILVRAGRICLIINKDKVYDLSTQAQNQLKKNRVF